MHSTYQKFLELGQQVDVKTLSRVISLLENNTKGSTDFLQALKIGTGKIIGLTGPPGAGKSTLTDGMISHYVENGKKIAVLCIDPSSAFNYGALLGDRIRMSQWYTNPQVYIRSLASRGALGGLNPSTMEISDVLLASGFDYVIIETVGVGQSEIEIAGLAHCTVVALVPEGGDEVQALKAGIMEIAQVFAINKSDRPDADKFKNYLNAALEHMPAHAYKPKIISTIANSGLGVKELVDEIHNYLQKNYRNEHYFMYLTNKSYQYISNTKMKNILKPNLYELIVKEYTQKFNVYAFSSQYC